MTWARMIVLGLEIIKFLLDEGLKRKWINEGEQRAIAASTAEALRKTNYAKAVLEEVGKLSDSELDDFLRKFEPRG